MRAMADGVPEQDDVFDAELESSQRTGRACSTLRAGDTASEFHLTDNDGLMVSLTSTLNAGPAMLSFLTEGVGDLPAKLAMLDAHVADIAGAGASILIFSPFKLSAQYAPRPVRMLHDVGSAVANSYGLCASAPPSSDIVPATFIVDQNAQIVMSLTDACIDHELVLASAVGTLRALQHRQQGERRDNHAEMR